MPKSTSVQNLKFYLYPFQINRKGSPKAHARGWKEGREDETWERGKVKIGGVLVSSIPGEKTELPTVTGGGKGPEYHNEIKRYIMVY